MIPGTIPLFVEDGVVVIASDCHYVPGEEVSTAHRALVELVNRFADDGSLSAVILNGDVADFPEVSKHARIGWEQQPGVAEELDVLQCRLADISEVAFGRSISNRPRVAFASDFELAARVGSDRRAKSRRAAASTSARFPRS